MEEAREELKNRAKMSVVGSQKGPYCAVSGQITWLEWRAGAPSRVCRSSPFQQSRLSGTWSSTLDQRPVLSSVEQFEALAELLERTRLVSTSKYELQRVKEKTPAEPTCLCMATSGSKRPTQGVSCYRRVSERSRAPCDGESRPLGDCWPLKSVRGAQSIVPDDEKGSAPLKASSSGCTVPCKVAR